jgi:L,D-peptidoglycan transpeptidase YkuD (ErfK/YbiS/YcfS/YnhG family)
MHILINNKYLFFNEYRIKCAVGKRGIGIKKKEGDLITPKGLYKIKFILFRKERLKNLKTKIKKLVIKKNMGWCNDSRSKNYNKLITFPFRYGYEKLFRPDNIYDVILVLDYNINPIQKNKGSAIFIHIAKKDYRKTEGCVAINKKYMLKILKMIKKNTRVKII